MQRNDGPAVMVSTQELEKHSVSALFELRREGDGADILAVENVMFLANGNFGSHPSVEGIDLLWRATMQAVQDVQLGAASRIDDFERRIKPASPDTFLQTRLNLRTRR